MKRALSLIPLVFVLTACGHTDNSDNVPVTTSSAVESCSDGQVYYNNGCYTTTYGNPGEGNYSPVSGVTIPQRNYCDGRSFNGRWGQPGGGRLNCWDHNGSYSWGVSGSMIYYW